MAEQAKRPAVDRNSPEYQQSLYRSGRAVLIGVVILTVSICRQLVVLIPAAWLLSRTGEVNMVWWAFIIAEVVSLALSLVFMARINRTVIVPLSEKQDAAI